MKDNSTSTVPYSSSPAVSIASASSLPATVTNDAAGCDVNRMPSSNDRQQYSNYKTSTANQHLKTSSRLVDALSTIDRLNRTPTGYEVC